MKPSELVEGWGIPLGEPDAFYYAFIASAARILRAQPPGDLTRSTGQWKPLVRETLARRDGPFCGICKGAPFFNAQRDWMSAEELDEASRLSGADLYSRAIDGLRACAVFEIDHVVALSLDGDHAMANLQLLCPRCHRQKTVSDVRELNAAKSAGRQAVK